MWKSMDIFIKSRNTFYVIVENPFNAILQGIMAEYYMQSNSPVVSQILQYISNHYIIKNYYFLITRWAKLVVCHQFLFNYYRTATLSMSCKGTYQGGRPGTWGKYAQTRLAVSFILMDGKNLCRGPLPIGLIMLANKSVENYQGIVERRRGQTSTKYSSIR